MKYTEFLKIARVMRAAHLTTLAAKLDHPGDDRELKLLNLLVRTSLQLVELRDIPAMGDNATRVTPMAIGAPHTLVYGFHNGQALEAPEGWFLVPNGIPLLTGAATAFIEFRVSPTGNGFWSAAWPKGAPPRHLIAGYFGAGVVGFACDKNYWNPPITPYPTGKNFDDSKPCPDGYKMTKRGSEYGSYAQFLAVGWTDAALIDHGWMEKA